MRIFPASFIVSLVALGVGCQSAQTPHSARPANLASTRPVSSADPYAPTAANPWFPGLNDPPLIDVSLPNNFTIVTVDHRGEWNMYSGVLWAERETAEPLAGGKTKDLSRITKPLFWVHLSEEVAQKPGTDTFTNEAGLQKAMTAVGCRGVETRKIHWGSYPVLCLTGTRPNGSAIHIAWIGLNTPEGDALIVDYRVPRSGVYSEENAAEIWRSFLEKTQPRS